MGIVTLVSASGSPGVTSTAVGLALTWPRPVVLVEADPTGGSGILAGFFRASTDQRGLIDLVMAHRSGVLAEALPRLLMPVPGSHASVLVGSKAHEQAAGLERVWDPLLLALRGLVAAGQDVIVDAGRLGLDGSPRPLIHDSDLTLLVSRTTLPALAAARSWARVLGEETLPTHPVRVLLVGEGRPYRSGEVTRTLGLPALGSVTWDPARAAVFSDGAPHPHPRPGVGWLLGGEKARAAAFDRSGYLGSVRAAGEAIRGLWRVADEREARSGSPAPATEGDLR
ncbi:MAG: hypothetical protein IPL43_00155 [Micropruina sp.]|nr:hypothetical protein [Micropruina sp.]